MTLDGFLTFLALIVAVYALTSPTEKLRIRLKVNLAQVVLAVSAFSLVMYFEFFDVFKQPCYVNDICEWVAIPSDGFFQPRDAAFLVVLVWALFAFLLHRASTLGVSSLPQLYKLVDELLVERRYAELIEIIGPHLVLIDKASRRELSLQILHDRFLRISGKAPVEVVLKSYEDEDVDEKGVTLHVLKRFIGHIYLILPSQENEEVFAKNILRSIYSSDKVRHFLVEQRPYAAIPLLRLENNERQEFSHLFFRDLIASTSSALYLEIRGAQNIRFGSIEGFKNSRLLYFLFSDVNVAVNILAWKPIGDYLLRRLDPALYTKYIEQLQEPAPGDDDLWGDPIYVGIEFFRLMVDAAMTQGADWHMWLYYLPKVLKKLEESYDSSGAFVDPEAEFPTRSARLIYEVVHVLGEMVSDIQSLEEDSIHRNIPNNFKLANNNIPASAAVALGRCLKTIVQSTKLDEKFRINLYECMLNDIKGIGHEGDAGKLRCYLIESLIKGGDVYFKLEENQGYGDFLGRALLSVDHILWDDVRDYINSLDRAYPGSLPERLRRT